MFTHAKRRVTACSFFEKCRKRCRCHQPSQVQIWEFLFVVVVGGGQQGVVGLNFSLTPCKKVFFLFLGQGGRTQAPSIRWGHFWGTGAGIPTFWGQGYGSVSVGRGTYLRGKGTHMGAGVPTSAGSGTHLWGQGHLSLGGRATHLWRQGYLRLGAGVPTSGGRGTYVWGQGQGYPPLGQGYPPLGAGVQTWGCRGCPDPSRRGS